MRRFLLSLALAVVVGGTVLGAAASLGLTDSTLGAGSAVVAACDQDGIEVSWPGRGGEPGLTRWLDPPYGFFDAYVVAFRKIDDSCFDRPTEVVLTGPGLTAPASVLEWNQGSAADEDYLYAYFSQVNAELVTGVHLLIR